MSLFCKNSFHDNCLSQEVYPAIFLLALTMMVESMLIPLNASRWIIDIAAIELLFLTLIIVRHSNINLVWIKNKGDERK